MAIGDLDLPQISFTGQPQTTEGNGYVTFTIELSDPVSAPVTVFYRTVPGTADDLSVDFDSGLGEIRFEANETVATFSVFVRSDVLGERDESYFVELFNPVGATFGGRNHSLRATGWILDDDAGGGQNSIEVAAPVVLEGNGSAQFVVSLSEASATDTTVTFETVADSAKPSKDFVAETGTVTIEAGEIEAAVSVALRNDSAREAGESFGLAVSASGGRTAFGRATILDNDGREPTISVEGTRRVEGNGYLQVTLRLSEASDSPVTVDFRTLNGTALGATLDYDQTEGTVTFAPGDHTAVANVFVRSDTTGEADEAFFVEFNNPVGAGFGGRNHSLRTPVWIADNDPGGGTRAVDVVAPVVVEGKGEAVFTVTLSEAFTERTTLRYATIDGSAKAGGDFKKASGRLTFEAGQTEATVSVALKNDRQAEAGETFGLEVTGPGGLAGHGIASLVDDDRRPGFSIERAERIETNGYQIVTVRLAEPVNAATEVDLRSIDGTAKGGSVDYDTLADTIVFAANDTTATAQVFVRSDSVSESDEHFYLALSDPVGGRFGAGDLAPRAIVWVLDDDPGSQKRALAVSDVRVSESARTADFTISLSRPLEDDLVIRYKTQNGSARAKDFAGEKGKITVAAGATEAVVSVKLKDDRRDEGNETFRLKLTAFDRDDFANSGHDTLATATILDDDGRGRLAWDADLLL